MNPFRKPAVVVDVPDVMRVDLVAELRKAELLLRKAQASSVDDRFVMAAEALGIITVLCDALPGGGR